MSEAEDQKLSEALIHSICAIKDFCNDEDVAVRERQIRVWRRLKLLWEGYSNVWYSEVAHDWRIWDLSDSQASGDNTDQAYYDKPINVFRAYLESVIAALSVVVPPIKCFPDDADNTLDLATAKAGDKIAKLVLRHNKADLEWIHALFIYCTEGMTACYNHPVASEKFGMYEEKEYNDEEETHQISSCPQCGAVMNDQMMDNPQVKQVEDKIGEELDKYAPDDEDAPLQNAIQNEDMCPSCMEQVIPQITEDKFVVTRLVGKTSLPKSRIKLEVFGGLNVKVPNYARNQEEAPYLRLSRDINYVMALEKYDALKGARIAELKQKISSAPGEAGGYTQYDQWGRLSPQYQGDWPLNVVTEEIHWFRPAAYNFLAGESDKIAALKKRFPNGCKATFINDHFVEACNACLDDEWTVNYNPLSDFIHYNPLGLLLTSVQDITNELISLILQTIEHGIGQTFADPGVLSFKQYGQTETTPGGVFPATAKTGKSLADGFHELRTATLSQEVMPFQQYIQSMGQLSTGALPSLFGGQIEGAGGDTASGYSMSRAQALQRLQNTWKMYTDWWKDIFGKVIPMYIKEVKDDERDVSLDNDGNFINTFIRKAELEGKIGRIELEANENLPVTWGQKKDMLLQLLQATNPQIMEFLNAPENRAVIHEYLGLEDFYMPGEDDIIKQYDEIRILLESAPIPNMQDVDGSMPELPSVEIDPIFDNNQIEFEIVRKWVISETGRDAKASNPAGYANVLLHGKMHFMQVQMQQAQMQAAASQGNGATPNDKPNPKQKEAPVTGEGDVSAQA